jgi:hypothetical protein
LKRKKEGKNTLNCRMKRGKEERQKKTKWRRNRKMRQRIRKKKK